MVRIELTPNDVQDLLEILEYAKKKCELDMPKTRQYRWNDSGYYILRIDQLKEVVKGKKTDIIYRSNFNL